MSSSDEDKEDPPFKKGEKVLIIRGSYKKNKSGTFIRYAGDVSADVAVKGDAATERCLRLSSIARIKEEKTKAKEKDEMTLVSKEEYYNIVSYIEAIPLEDYTCDKVEALIVKIVDKMEQLAAEGFTLERAKKMTEEDIRRKGDWSSNNNFNRYFKK